MDPSAALARAFARPIRAMFEPERDVAFVRAMAERRPRTTQGVADSNLVRALAWMALTLLFVPLAVIDAYLAVEVANVVWNVVRAGLVITGVFAVLHAIRAGIAHQSDEEEWSGRGSGIPGNVELVAVALTVIALGVLMTRG